MRHPFDKMTIGVAAIFLALAAVIWTVTLDRIRLEREQAVQEAFKRNADLAVALEEQTVRTLGGIDLMLGFVKYEYARQGKAFDLAGLLDEAQLDESIYSGIAVIDENGNRVTGIDRSTPLDASDRDYFTVHRDQAAYGLFISPPRLGRVTGKCSIHMSRRIAKPDGSFGGVVLGAVKPEHLSRFYDQANLGKGGLVALTGLDGTTRVRRAGGKDAFGADMRTSTLFAELAKRPAGSYTSVETDQDVKRLYSYRTLAKYPMVVSVATGQSEVLGELAPDERMHYLLAAARTALMLAIAVAVLMVISHQRRARRIEEAALREGDRRAIAGYERLLDRLATLAQELATASNMPSVFKSLRDFVQASAPCNGIFVWLYDVPSQMRGCVYAWSGGREEDASRIPPMPMTGIPDSRGVISDSRALHSSMVVPMAVMGRVIGAMEIQSVERAAYGDDHLTALRMAAHLAGMAVENVRLLEDERGMRRYAEESERRNAAILESALDAIVTIDNLGKVVEFNPAAERIFGYSRRDAIGRDIAQLILSPLLHQGEHESFVQRLQVGDGFALNDRMEMPAARVNGEQFPVELSIARISSGDPPLFTWFIRDITERKTAEQAHESLESQLRESQKMEAIGRLAGGVAHDFNNILGSILGNLELAREDTSGNARAQESLDEIQKAGLRARDLVQQILSFSRRQPTARRVVHLPEVVEESVRLLRATLPARVQVDCKIDASTPVVLADPSQMGQVLLNLGTNAAHAIAEMGLITIRVGGVVLDGAAAKAVAGLRPGLHAVISVTDTGTGIDEAHLDQIFEPFFTTKAVGEGTGLGLSVAHGIMRAHDGAIVVRSEPGKGSRFELYLPSAEGIRETEAPKEIVPEKITASGEHILYIDDDEALVYIVKRLLERQGYRVSGYRNPRLALEALRSSSERFHLVITDYSMPGMSGLDVARAIRELRPSLPVAMASGYVTDELKTQAAEAGIRELIFKQNVVDEFCEVVHRLVSGAGHVASERLDS
jgi:PAS domain S-box-containing protein